MDVTAHGPAGTAHNPFAGQHRGAGAPAFPADRYRTVGAADDELNDFRTYWRAMSAEERADAAAWHDEVDDGELMDVLARFREARDAYAALGSLTDEQRAAWEALTEDEQQALAALTPDERAALGEARPGAGELTDEQATALAALTDDERAALAALSPEDREALAAVPAGDGTAAAADGGSQAAAGGMDGVAAGAEAPDGGNDAQGGDGAPAATADNPSAAAAPAVFQTRQIGDLKIVEVDELIETGQVTAQQALDAELARGDDARKTLVDKLQKLAAE